MGWSRSLIKGHYQYIATRYPRTVIEKLQSEPDSSRLGIGLMFDTLNAPFIPGYFDPDQLYDLSVDPFERNNLVNDPAQAGLLAELKAELRQVLLTLPRPFPEEPDPFLDTEPYCKLLEERKHFMSQIVHYPRNSDVPVIWYTNQRDPDA